MVLQPDLYSRRAAKPPAPFRHRHVLIPTDFAQTVHPIYMRIDTDKAITPIQVPFIGVDYLDRVHYHLQIVS